MADPCDIVESAAAATATLPRSVLTPVMPLESAGTLVDEAISGLAVLFTSAAEATTSVIDSRGALLTSEATAKGSIPKQTAHAASLVVDRAIARSIVFSSHADMVTDAGILTDAVIQQAMADLARASATVSGTATGTVNAADLAEAAAVGAGMLLQLVYENLLETNGVASGVAVGFMDAVDLASASGTLTDSATGVADVIELAGVTGTLTVRLTDQLDALQLVQDEAWAMAAVLGEANGMTWWTAATDTLGMSRYRMPAFRAIAPVAGELMAVGETGAYARAGADDDGAPIDAYVRTGLHDFGSEFLKRVDHLYVGYVSGGSMQVDVGETSAGDESTYSYTMPPRAATAPTHGRIRLGRGLRSLYYRLTLRNTDGEPIRITRAGVDVNNTGRKV